MLQCHSMMLLYFFAVIIIILVAFSYLDKPPEKSDWVPEHKIQATVHIDGGRVKIFNYVKADYKDRYHADVVLDNLEFNLGDINSVYLLFDFFEIKLPWQKTIKPAHLFLSFDIKGHDNIAISIAGRRVKGDKVGFSRILPHRVALFYKFILEKDTIVARQLAHSDLYKYKLLADKEQISKLFIGLSKRANDLSNKSEWFDTFTKNCTTETMKHLKKAGFDVPVWNKDYILTMNLDKTLFKRGTVFENVKHITDFEQFKQEHSIST